jgi:hypothetical protein
MLNAIPIKIPMTSITKNENSTLTFIWKHKRPLILSKKSNTGGITIPVFRLYYRVTATKTAWYWNKNRHEDQWNRRQVLAMNPWTYTLLIFGKGTQNT